MVSGTTAKVADLLKRRWLGTEVSGDYVRVANERLVPYLTDIELSAVK